jgi:hypothetical protein
MAVHGYSPLTASIHMLDDDSLLHVFYLYRPFLLGEDDEDKRSYIFGGEGGWDSGNWWYKLARVCQRWRSVVLGSTAYLDIFLVCSNGTPVADMLAHSPPLPLVIDYHLDGHNDFNAEDEEGAILSFKQYDRVRRVRLWMPPTILQKLIAAMDDEYPILEYLIIWHATDDMSTILTLPETLQAPHLRHLMLISFAIPIGSRLLTTSVGLVTLCLVMVNPSNYFYPNTLFRWLSFMPQLENLVISLLYPDRSRNVEGQFTHMPITTPVTLPNLLVFRFKGVTTYFEALLYRLSAPRLEKLQITFLNQLTFPVPRLLNFMDTTESLRFKSATFEFFDEYVNVEVYPYEEAKMAALSITVNCWHLDWQVSSAAQIFDSLGSVFSAVEHLTLKHQVHIRSTEEHNKADPIKWRQLLNSFRNLKTLRIATGLVEDLSRCLESDDGELPLDLLPELEELTYSGSVDTGDAFTPFIDAHQDAGRSITLLRRSPSPDPSSRASSLEPSEASPIIPASGEAGSDLDT